MQVRSQNISLKFLLYAPSAFVEFISNYHHLFTMQTVLVLFGIARQSPSRPVSLHSSLVNRSLNYLVHQPDGRIVAPVVSL
jgi:hypothetical protein